MRIKLLILTYLFLFFGVSSVFAIDPPTLLSPTNNSTVSSSTLNWQASQEPLYSSNPYRVQVDDNPSFSPSSDIYRDTYKSSTNYSPVLTYGTWYWRVKVRDTTGTWSEWSNTWSFNLSDSTSSPTPTPTPTSTTSPTSTPSPTSSSSSSSFTISGLPSNINSNQSFSAVISLTLPNNPSTTFYLKGAFKKADGSNYFGQTKVSGNWIKNGSSSSSQFPITTDSSGNWSGNLEVKPDSEDSGFTGSGEYTFKVGRYTSSGSGPTWSNELSLNIEAIAQTADQSSEKNDNPSSAFENETPTPSTISKSVTSKISNIKYQSATVAGASFSASPSATPQDIEIKNQKQINPLLVVGIFLVFAGIASLGYIYLKRK